MSSPDDVWVDPVTGSEVTVTPNWVKITRNSITKMVPREGAWTGTQAQTDIITRWKDANNA